MTEKEEKAIEIVKKYKEFIYYNVMFMTEAEYWRLKCYGEI